MTFWKVSDTRMNCLITEAEIAALGYSLEDLTQDRERTEEFLNLLLKKGKEVLGLNTDNGIQGFYGAFLPDRSLMLSISCQAENSLESIQKDGSEASGMLIEPDSSEKETVRWCREMLQNSPMEEIETVLNFCQKVGLPVTLAEMGVKEDVDGKIMAVAKATCAEGETIHNMPGGATPDQVYAALLVADQYGQRYLQEWE